MFNVGTPDSFAIMVQAHAMTVMQALSSMHHHRLATGHLHKDACPPMRQLNSCNTAHMCWCRQVLWPRNTKQQHSGHVHSASILCT